MNITLNITLPDVLTAFLTRFLAESSGAPLPVAAAPALAAPPAPAAQEAPKAAPKPRTAAKPAADPAPSQPTAEAAVAAAPTTTASPSDDTQSCTYDDVKAVVLAYGAKFGRDAIVDLLARYGVTSGKALKTGVYDQFVAEANTCIGAGKVAA